ncbi:beta-ketoacyl-ACP synthase III [Blastomonas aquatica]|uniref:Beta-ketoacyl-[acyl-carrier-protein] synthase III n=1 Tax=Blastomonas aquatica TaxID=1510276 RepID=A0ABQ1J8S7_9SPHN|nr:beta-ketoacyl-ACP synthase III [Blastomonas aquatica]GGB60325.1 3-oxoacyl-[acyl-carrier-protein] synthase 3 [Blastomonas aquatica]
MNTITPVQGSSIQRSVILGTGSALPKRRVSNAELAETVDTSDDWITERTGIKFRYLAGPEETTSTLAIGAARAALEAAGLEGTDIELIVLATATPDHTFPATATKVQAAIGMNGGIAFDVAAVCSGFLYALSVADSMLRTGMARRALVIGAETFSRILDWEDRGTCVLFGDGAGAVVLGLENSAEDDTAPRGILATQLHADGRHHDLLYVDGGPSTTGTVGKVRMRGREVFRHAVVNLAEVMEQVMKPLGLTSADIDWVVPHQANARILDATARKLCLPPEKVVITVDQHANTSAASVPLALDTAVRDGRIQRGDLMVLEAMGGGLTWGAAVVRY